MNRISMLATILLVGCWNRGIARNCLRRKLAYIVGAGLIALVRTEVSWAYAPFCWPSSPSPNAVFVYDGANSNACVIFQDGDKFPDLGSIGWDNRISSITVGSDVRVVLYERPNFQGAQAHYEGGWHYQLGDTDNRTSSIEIFTRQGGPAATWYLGDYPKNRENFWSNDTQGLANDGASWFVVKGYNADNTRLFKVPLSYDLGSSFLSWAIDVNAGRLLPPMGIPSILKNVGYNHFGDPDVDKRYGFLFVPLEGGSKPRIAVFSPVDLRFLSSFELSDSPNGNAPWLAIHPKEQTLWVSTFDLGDSNQIREYGIDWDRLGVDGQLILTFRRQVTLRDRDGVILNLKSLQGGVFNPEGTLLYISTGKCDSNGYVHVFAIEDDTNTATLQARSENGYGPFNFETHWEMTNIPFKGWVCSRDEAEGLDWLDVRDLNIPGIPDGQLHLVMIDNDLTDDDNLYLKHYSY